MIIDDDIVQGGVFNTRNLGLVSLVTGFATKNH